MHFFARYHVTRTHRSTLMTAAFANTDAAFERIGKTAFVLGVLEISTHLRRTVFSSIPQILIARIRKNHLARIHFPIWTPDLSKPSKPPTKFFANHLGHNFA